MGMAADDVSNANQARAEAKSDMYKGIATVGSSLTSMGGVGGGEKTTEVLPDGTVNVVGGTASVGGISTPENVTGQPEVIGATGGSNASWNAGNAPPQFGYVNGVWQQIN